MKTIGLLGGMSWESSIEYERTINEEVRRRLGGLHSADLVIRSYDFARIEALQAAERWEEAGRLLANDARNLAAGGADLIVLCTNTMHLVAEAVAEAVDVPFLHIADATADAVLSRGLSSVGLLGTRFTMERPFYRRKMEERGLDVVVPAADDRQLIDRVIFDELVKGVIDDGSRGHYLEIIRRLVDGGAQGIVAGCTEIEFLVGPADVPVPYFPSARLHALAAVDAALS